MHVKTLRMQTYFAARLGSPFELVLCVQTYQGSIVYTLLSLNNAVAAWSEATGAVHAIDFCSARPLQLVDQSIYISCLQDSPGPGRGVNRQ